VSTKINIKMSTYGAMLFMICALDLASTTIGISLGLVAECNPLFLKYLNLFGINGLIMAKLILNFFSLFLLEIAFKLDNKKMSRIYMIVIIVYICIYAVGGKMLQ